MKLRLAILFFAAGIASGVLLWGFLLQGETDEKNQHEQVKKNIAQQENQQSYDINQYRNQIIDLQSKVKDLTEKLNIAQQKNTQTNSPVKHSNLRKIKILTQEILMEAGIDEVSAQEIVRRKDEYEYKRLDLRDRAVREGITGTAWFRKESARLQYSDASIRDELGDEVFDRYLYATGKSNRVEVSSIMQGSPAESAGVMKGDVIISYDEKRVFSWHNLNKLTASGQREESVILNVERNGEIFNILLPRGPLGVKLEVNRILP